MRPRFRAEPRLRIFGEWCCAWPVWGEGSEDVEAAVTPELRQDLLDWQQFWQDSQGVDDWTSSLAADEYVQRGRQLKHRMEHELHEPVAFHHDTGPRVSPLPRG